MTQPLTPAGKLSLKPGPTATYILASQDGSRGSQSQPLASLVHGSYRPGTPEMGLGPHFVAPQPPDQFQPEGRPGTPSREPLVSPTSRSALQASTSGRVNPLYSHTWMGPPLAAATNQVRAFAQLAGLLLLSVSPERPACFGFVYVPAAQDLELGSVPSAARTPAWSLQGLMQQL